MLRSGTGRSSSLQGQKLYGLRQDELAVNALLGHVAYPVAQFAYMPPGDDEDEMHPGHIGRGQTPAEIARYLAKAAHTVVTGKVYYDIFQNKSVQILRKVVQIYYLSCVLPYFCSALRP